MQFSVVEFAMKDKDHRFTMLASFLVTLFCVLNTNVFSADNHRQLATRVDQDQAAPVHAASFKSGRLAQVVPSINAESKATENWRRRNIRKAFRKRSLGSETNINTCLEKILAGDDNCQEEGISLADLTTSSGALRASTPALASSVGMLLIERPGKQAVPLCTVSLVQPGTGLTALHCWKQVHAGDVLKVFFPYEGIREVDLDNIEPFEIPRQQSCVDPEGTQPEIDMVIMRLQGAPYSIITPEPVTQGPVQVQGSKALVAGYGFDVESDDDHGISRKAVVYLNSCEPQDAGSDDTQDILGAQLCFSYDPEDPDTVAMMGYDSGGPMFQLKSDGEAQAELRGDIIGVAKGGGTGSLYGQAVYLNLADTFYQPWLKAKLDSSEAIASMDVLFDVLSEDPAGLISPLTDSVSYRFEGENKVSDLARELIITMNHQPGPEMFPNNLDLRLGDGIEPDCTRLASVEECRIQCPQPGVFEFSVGWGNLEEPDGTPFSPRYEVEYQTTTIVVRGSRNDGLCSDSASTGSEPAVAPNSTGITIVDKG